MNNIISFIDIKSDIWVFPASDDLSPYTFKFNFLPNEWFNDTIKQITKDCINIGRLKMSTLHRYNYGLEVFFQYLNTNKIVINTFQDITFSVMEGFIHYLVANITKPQSRDLALASLKHHIKHGQLFEWHGFPLYDLFDGTERRTLQKEDTLKSMLIDDRTISNIDSALHQMKLTLNPNVDNLNENVLWTLITVIRHTGIRLSEALRLKENCIRKDLMGKYLLEVNSDKNDTDRFIPVSHMVFKGINFLIQTRADANNQINKENLFYVYDKRNKKYKMLKQNKARLWLKEKFIAQYDIRDGAGNLIKLNYHQFRHQIGTELLNNGFSMFEVQQYLGHDSLHSTRLYAKVRNDRLTNEYKKIGFIGYLEKETNEIVDESGKKIDSEKRLMAQLPDGICAKPISKDIVNCKKPNACLFCPKFITTPEFLDIHKDHLERIRKDKDRYIEENLIGTDYLLLETESVLEEIVSKLETIQMEDNK